MCQTPRSPQGRQGALAMARASAWGSRPTHLDAYGPGPIMDEVNPRDPLFDPAEYIPHNGSIIFEPRVSQVGADMILGMRYSVVSLDVPAAGTICVIGGCGSPSINTPSTTAGGASKIWG